MPIPFNMSVDLGMNYMNIHKQPYLPRPQLPPPADTSSPTFNL